jgi:hypothetical protein
MERPAQALIPSQRAVYDELELVVSFAMSLAQYTLFWSAKVHV